MSSLNSVIRKAMCLFKAQAEYNQQKANQFNELFLVVEGILIESAKVDDYITDLSIKEKSN